MSEDQIDALNFYTLKYAEGYGYNDKIVEIFEKIEPLTRSLVVFRSMDIGEMYGILASYESKKLYDSFLESGKAYGIKFLSTSVDPLVAMSYNLLQYKGKRKAKGLLKLTIPSGKKAVVAEPTGANKTANEEIILMREGLKIKVDQVTRKDDFSFIEATVV